MTAKPSDDKWRALAFSFLRPLMHYPSVPWATSCDIRPAFTERPRPESRRGER